EVLLVADQGGRAAMRALSPRQPPENESRGRLDEARTAISRCQTQEPVSRVVEPDRSAASDLSWCQTPLRSREEGVTKRPRPLRARVARGGDARRQLRFSGRKPVPGLVSDQKHRR